MFDTDGEIYQKQKKYKRAIIEFQNHSPSIRKNIISLLKNAEFNYSKSSIIYLRIQDQKEVHRFFEEIGSSNPKNIIRYKEFIKTGQIRLKEELVKDILNYEGDQPFKMRS